MCTDSGCFCYLLGLLRRLPNIQRGIKCKSDVCDLVIPNVTHDFLVDISPGQTSKSYLLHRVSNGALSGNLLKPCSKGQAPRMVLVFSNLKWQHLKFGKVLLHGWSSVPGLRLQSHSIPFITDLSYKLVLWTSGYYWDTKKCCYEPNLPKWDYGPIYTKSWDVSSFGSSIHNLCHKLLCLKWIRLSRDRARNDKKRAGKHHRNFSESVRGCLGLQTRRKDT